MEEITHLCFTSLQPENTSKVQGQAGSALAQIAFAEVAVGLVKVEPVDLCPCIGPEVLNEESTAMCSEDQ